jgi:hypothetical protein
MIEDILKRFSGENIKNIKEYQDKTRIQINGILVFLPNNYEVKNDFFCNLCAYPMKDYQDDKSFEEYGCCEFCDTNIVRPNMKKWKEGWRPSNEEIEELVKSKFYNKV